MLTGPSALNGLASTQRVQNLFFPLLKKKLIELSNLDLSNSDKDISNTIGIKYQNIKYTSYLSYLFKIRNGKKFISKNYNPNVNNIFYVYGYPSILNIAFIKFSKKVGYKIVFDIVEDITTLKSINPFKAIKRYIAFRLFKRIHKITNTCFAISDILVSKIKTSIPKLSGVYKLPACVDFTRLPEPKQSIKQNDPLEIFYGGSFGSKDGLKFLLEATKALVNNNINIKLVLTGKGNKTDFESFFNTVEKLKLKKHIDYKGFVSTKEYLKLLSHSDICCITRINSPFANAGFPFKLGEFLASGKPVIATNIGEISSYLNNTNAILIEPENSESLVDSLIKLLNSSELRKELGQAGQETAYKYFDAEKVSQELYKTLQNLR